MRERIIIIVLALLSSYGVVAYDDVLDLELNKIIEAGSEEFLVNRINHGADINKQDEFGITPLIKAASSNNVRFFKILLLSGADLDLADIGGMTPTHIAARDDNIDILDLCLENGANLNAVDVGGWTPLMHAAANANVNVTRMLILAGADTAMSDYGGNNALAYAAMSNNIFVVREIINTEQHIMRSQQHNAIKYARNNQIIDLLEDIIYQNDKIVESNEHIDAQYETEMEKRMQQQRADSKILTSNDEVSRDKSEKTVIGLIENVETSKRWQYMLYLGSFKTIEGARQYWQDNVRFIVNYEEGNTLPAIVKSQGDISRLYIGFFSREELAQDVYNILAKDNNTPCRIIKSIVNASNQSNPTS